MAIDTENEMKKEEEKTKKVSPLNNYFLLIKINKTIIVTIQLIFFLKEYSQWPTYPQLYIAGELVGGCDIIMDLYN
jgi:glutaredoxin-related protein